MVSQVGRLPRGCPGLGLHTEPHPLTPEDAGHGWGTWRAPREPQGVPEATQGTFPNSSKPGHRPAGLYLSLFPQGTSCPTRAPRVTGRPTLTAARIPVPCHLSPRRWGQGSHQPCHQAQ